MSRLVNLVLLTVMLVGAAVTYDMKLKAEKAAERVVRLESAVQEQKDAIQLLRAELSMLVQPGRLQAVVEHYADHFKLEDFQRSQYATVEEIPLKPPGPADGKAVADMIDGRAATSDSGLQR
jgi:hypothetical protein